MNRPYTLRDFDFELPAELIAQHPARRAQRLAPARRHRRRRPSTASSASCRRCCSRATCWCSTTRASSRRGCSAPRRAAARSRRWSSACCRATRCWRTCARASRREPGSRVRFVGAEPPRRSTPRCWAAAARRTRCSTCAFRPTRSRCWSATATCRCRPTSRMPTSADDERRYQTVFAARPGAVAAPTAALHFDEALLAALRRAASRARSVTLHVGAGTFQPVRSENLAEHRMHSEWFEVGAGHRRGDRGARVPPAAASSRSARRPCARSNRRPSARRRQRCRPAPRDRHLHHAGLRVPRRRPAADQLPPAQEHADDAGQRVRRHRAHPRALRATRSRSATASSATATRC